MVVDHSSTMRRIIANTLKKLGFDDIVEAADGVEGLQRVAAGAPGLILADWNMPNMDGREFVRTLRTKPGMETIPVLMVTTHANRTDVVLALQAGVNDYVVKPFTPETMKEKIETLLEQAGRVTTTTLGQASPAAQPPRTSGAAVRW
jgi:two-component system chemotaxis response regulator CheY